MNARVQAFPLFHSHLDGVMYEVKQRSQHRLVGLARHDLIPQHGIGREHAMVLILMLSRILAR